MTGEDHTTRAGGAALGARLRRLSEAIDGDATRIYAAMGFSFEQRWFGVLDQLARNGPATAGELAATLRITHVSVSQTRQSLEKAGIIETPVDPADLRRRRLSLTSSGSALVERLTPLWAAFEEAARALNTEADDVVASLDRLDAALQRRSLFDRIMEARGRSDVLAVDHEA